MCTAPDHDVATYEYPLRGCDGPLPVFPKPIIYMFDDGKEGSATVSMAMVFRYNNITPADVSPSQGSNEENFNVWSLRQLKLSFAEKPQPNSTPLLNETIL